VFAAAGPFSKQCVKPRRLKTKLVIVSIVLGAVLTGTLLALQWAQHRQAVEQVGRQGEQTLLAIEQARLVAEAADIAAAHAVTIEEALRSRDREQLEQAAEALLREPFIVRVQVRDRNGQLLIDLRRREAQAVTGAEHQAVDRELGDAQLLGVLHVEAAYPGLQAAAAVLRAQLQRLEQERFVNWMGMLLLLGLAITAILVMSAFALARRLERPIAAMIRSAERIGEGDYTQPLAVTSKHEIAELEQALEQMRQKLAQSTITSNYLTSVLNSMTDAVLVTGPSGTITRVNDAALRLFSGTPEQLCGKTVTDFVVPAERERFPMTATNAAAHETVIATYTGQTIPVSVAVAPITAPDPQFRGTIFVLRNITDRKRAERRIRYLARYDALTKIPNRMQFQHMLQQAIARARRSDRAIVLLYLDMDRFKEINDTFGHAAGDRTLEVLSERLTRSLPREAVVGRLAGDEFGLFIEGLPQGQDERTQAADLARLVLAEVGKGFYVQQQEVFLTASIGIAFCPKDADNVIDLIRNADAAMYHSKQNGGNTFAFYSVDMNAAAVERLMLKSKLRRALERDELVMFYQPKVDLRDGRIVGAEALLRWRLPGHGDISPSQFIPLAEETSLILGIGEWVMNRVCADYRHWTRQVMQPGRISINLSLKQLRQASFVTRCQSVFRRYEVAPANFELEITETTLMVDPKRTIKLLQELHAMGLHLSIDDFGTGYSSLSALQQFPIGTLKIDQSFVRDASIDSGAATIVRTIIDMGRSLNVEVIAEGVETEEQMQFLRKNGCHFGQGRLFGDAMSADEFLDLLIAQNKSGRSNVSELFA
jgi:diguanylate cyclase (GGDEF)-like protein/PAS domain S-box-containing protein